MLVEVGLRLKTNFVPTHEGLADAGVKATDMLMRGHTMMCDMWITDPPYADAVNYDELSEYFPRLVRPHLKALFPDWYTDSMRARAVKGDDAPFRVAMAECYKRPRRNTCRTTACRY